MENPEPQLVTMRCPCSNPNPCYSQTITSPKGLITVLFWECQGFTEQEANQELAELRALLNASFAEDDEDETS